jgi:phage shock protein A
MWSKLFNWKKTEAQAQAQPQNSPADMVRLALAEIDKNIAQNQQSLRETKMTQAQIQDKLKEQVLELNALTDKAEKALKKNEVLTAQNLLGKKGWIQEQVQQYQHLLAQLAHTIQQLEKQIAGLEMRKIEISTKETLLTAQLQKVTSQKEMQSYLGELDKTLGFDSYEKQIEAINIENQLANDILAFDEALQNSQPLPNVQDLQQQVAKEQQEVQAQKMNSIFGRYFDAQKNAQQEKKITQDYNAMRKDLLTSFFSQKQASQETAQQASQDSPTADKNNHKDKLINDFFTEKKPEPEPEPKSDKQKAIDDFFGKG